MPETANIVKIKVPFSNLANVDQYCICTDGFSLEEAVKGLSQTNVLFFEIYDFNVSYDAVYDILMKLVSKEETSSIEHFLQQVNGNAQS